MFWGMTLEPGKLYTETMGEEVQLSMAAIDSRKDLVGESSSTNFCQIVIQTEKGEYVLCTLVHGVMFQQSLDLKLMPREKVTFSVQGPSVVYLVGYTASYPEDEEEMRMQQEEYEEDSSAWETFEEGEQMADQIKQEPVEILDNSDTDVETDNKTEVQEQIAAGSQERMAPSSQEQIAPSSQEQTEDAATEETPQDTGEEMIFSVAEIDQSVVKTEPPDPDSDPPVTSGAVPPSQQQHLPPQEDIYGTQPSDHGISLPQTSTSQDFFYPETQQQQPNVQLTPPVAFQPINSGPDFQQQTPLGGALPPAETFLQTPQKTLMQRSHVGPVRQSSPRQPAQRTYPSPRRQYGTNRSQPAGKTRPAPQSMNIQQMRNVGNMQQQQQSMPGPSQMDVPGPSNSDFTRTSSAPGTHSQDQTYPISISQPKGKGQPPQTQSPAGVTVGGYCRKCGKYVSDVVRLRVHEKNHDKWGQYQCRFCSKQFGNSGNLKRHERSHTGEKPYKCPICGICFIRGDRLKSHQLKEHFSEVVRM